MKCQARIVRTYKKKKADCHWPHAAHALEYPQCDGEITVKVSIGGGCFCCSGPELEVEASCTVCKWPYHPKLEELKSRVAAGELDITDLLEER